MTNSFYSCVPVVRVNRKMSSTSPVTQNLVPRARCRFGPAVSPRVISSHAEPQASAEQATGLERCLEVPLLRDCGRITGNRETDPLPRAQIAIDADTQQGIEVLVPEKKQNQEESFEE
jgi:hypothetical protein